MSFRVLSLMTVTALLAACADRPTAPLTPAVSLKPSFSVTGGSAVSRHIVGFKANAVPANFAARVEALGATLQWSSDGMGMAVVSGLTDDAAAQLAAAADISDVTPDHELQMLEPSATDLAQADASVVTDDALTTAPNPAAALLYARQWDMPAIQADKAWAAGMRGSKSVKVAILDTGIDYENPDTKGLVDLDNSASFVPEDDALVAKYFPTKNPITDLHFHGTHVAATVASNARFFAGVTSGTTLMAVKVLSVNGTGATSRTLAGIAFATDHGADVINMSLGTLPFTVTPELRDFLRSVNRAILYAVAHGVNVVVSAGNGDPNTGIGYNLDALAKSSQAVLYCDNPAVICVSATGPTSQASVNGPWTNIDAFAPYSNYGLIGVDVAAPGGNGSSFVYELCSQTSLVFPVCQTPGFVFTLGLQGTSQAAPHVSGLAALTIAKLGGRRNLGRALAVRATIQATADDLGAPGYDAQYGSGRINVARALGLVRTPPRVFATGLR